MSWHTGEAEALLFGIQRSVRYHDRRLAYFEALHRTTSVATIVMSGVVITLSLIHISEPTRPY